MKNLWKALPMKIDDHWSLIVDRWSLIALDTYLGCTLCRVINCGVYPPITHRLCLAPGTLSVGVPYFLSILYAAHAALLINLRSWLLGNAPNPFTIPGYIPINSFWLMPRQRALQLQTNWLWFLNCNFWRSKSKSKRNEMKRNESNRSQAKIKAVSRRDGAFNL